jgi:hypothetical protein
MMEHLPANDLKAISASLKLVDEADIYIGVFAYRYGYIPKENNILKIAVTVMEYNRAVERKIPRLIFIMDKASIVAIGGMGKSALTWKWFKDIATEEMKPLAGRIWWSFYEPEANFESFITHSLAYVKRQPLPEILKFLLWEREKQLLAALNSKPFLIILDGLERLLIAYARMDAARIGDGQVYEERGFRKTIDPRIGRFLRKLGS